MGTHIRGLVASALCIGALLSNLSAALTVHIDMNMALDGIQATREANNGDVFEVAVVMEVGAEGLSSYGFSVTFDELELSLNSFNNTPPAGLSSLLPGVDIMDIGGSTKQLSSFDGFTFSTGPDSTSVIGGIMEFTVVNPSDNGVLDIVPGFFDPADGAFDNTLPIGGDLAPTAVLNGGSVIPEPSTAGLSLVAGLLLALRRSRRS